MESITINWPSLALSESDINRALRLAFLLIFKSQLRSLRGPKATPPWRQIGPRVDPARARPVPFCFQGFLPPPETSPRVLVEAVPRRRLARKFLTEACRSGMLTSEPKMESFRA